MWKSICKKSVNKFEMGNVGRVSWEMGNVGRVSWEMGNVGRVSSYFG